MCRSAVLAGRVVDTLGRPGNLQRGEKKQIPLRAGQNVRGGREDRVEGLVAPLPGQEEIGPVNAPLILALANDADLGLGAPLPAGTLRVYGPGGETAGGDGAALFPGPHSISHHPYGEKDALPPGAALHVHPRSERTQLDRASWPKIAW